MQYRKNVSKYDQTQIDAIYQYMTELTTKEFKAVILRFWGQFSINDIAKDLGVSWDMADQTLTRALEKLRSCYLRDADFQRKQPEVSAV